MEQKGYKKSELVVEVLTLMNTSSGIRDGHTHENLLTLDKIFIDDDNYLYLKTLVLMMIVGR